MFIQQLLNGNYVYFFGVVLSVMFSVCLHEYAHAFTALKLGDDTAARRGHLSLNPMIQMGPTSLILLCVLGLAWGAVPVNPAILRLKKFGEAKVAFAGPLVNLALCMISGFIFAGMYYLGSGADIVLTVLQIFCTLNGTLFILNMLPVPPLDGYTVLEEFVPQLRSISPATARQVGFYALIMIIATPVGGFIWSGGRGLAEIFMYLKFLPG